MSLTYVNLGDQLVNVRQICRHAPIPTVCRAYSRALREWCQQTWWLRFVITGSVVAGDRTYTLGTDTLLDIMAIRAISITDAGGVVRGLAPSDSSQWNMNLPPSLPRRYAYLAEGGFTLDPIPDMDYATSTSVVVMPKESASMIFQIPSTPLVKYSNDIEAGALAYLLMMNGEPWANPQQAQIYLRQFQAAIAAGKTEVQRSFNTGSMRARPRPFGTIGA